MLHAAAALACQVKSWILYGRWLLHASAAVREGQTSLCKSRECNPFHAKVQGPGGWDLQLL